MKRRLLSALLLVSLIMSMIPDWVYAADDDYWMRSPGAGYGITTSTLLRVYPSPTSDISKLSLNKYYLIRYNGTWMVTQCLMRDPDTSTRGFKRDNGSWVNLTYVSGTVYEVKSSTAGLVPLSQYAALQAQGWELVYDVYTIDHRWVGSWGEPRWFFEFHGSKTPNSYGGFPMGINYYYNDTKYSLSSQGAFGGYDVDWYDHYIIAQAGSAWGRSYNNVYPSVNFSTYTRQPGDLIMHTIKPTQSVPNNTPVPITIFRRDKRTAADVAIKSITTLDASTAQLTGEILTEGLPTVTTGGVLWSTNPTEALLRLGTANSASVAKNAVGEYQVNFTGLQPGITYYVRGYSDNGQRVGYTPIQSFKLDLPPNISRNQPAGSLIHAGTSIVYDYQMVDPEGLDVTGTMSVTDPGTGQVLYSGAPNVTSAAGVATHRLDTANIPLTWSAANNRYERQLRVTLTASDGTSQSANVHNVTIYNLKPSLELALNGQTLNINAGDPLILDGKAWDANGDRLTITATVAGADKSVVIDPAPTTKPGAENLSLIWDLPTGNYNNILVKATDPYGGEAEVNWSGSATITDVLGKIRDAINALTGPKESQLYYHLGNTGVTINQNEVNDTKAATIRGLSDNREAISLFTGRTGGTKSYLEPVFGQYIDADSGRNDALMTRLITDAKNYLDANPNTFVVGDLINWVMSIEDVENDYTGITPADKVLPYDTLDDILKKAKPGSVKVKYQHNPAIFDNPAQVHPLSGPDFLSVGDFASANVLKQATAAMRGEWTIEALCSDDTGTVFDKDSSPGQAKIIIHQRPVAAVNVNEDDNNLYLSGQPSYDIDYQVSKPDNGIKRYEWYFKTEDGVWDKLASDAKEVAIPKTHGGQLVTQYNLTVTDWHGAKDSLIEDVDFSLLAHLSVNKPYPEVLKTNDTFRATFRIVTDETITGVTSWVDPWGSSRAMTHQSKVGSTSIYTADFTVPGGIPDGIYNVFANVKTAEGHDVTRYCKINVLNNLPPTMIYQHVKSGDGNAVIYAGDKVQLTYLVDDPNLDVLDVNHVVFKDGVAFKNVNTTVSPAGGVYATQVQIIIDDAIEGSYEIKGVATDPFGASGEASITFDVRPLTISGALMPNPVRAGYWVLITAETDGYADSVTATVTTGRHAGQSTTMIPAGAVVSLENSWTAKYKTWEYEPDGTIPIVLTAKRGSHTATTTLNLTISGSMIEDNKASIKE